MSQRKFDFYIVPTPIGNIKDITTVAINTGVDTTDAVTIATISINNPPK